MANTVDTQRGIRSVKNTSQSTKAMQMVSASKMRKSQADALAGRPYPKAMDRVLGAIHGKVDPRENPLLEERPVHRELIVVISTDKGLCGPLNTNLFRELSTVDSASAGFVTV